MFRYNSLWPYYNSNYVSDGAAQPALSGSRHADIKKHRGVNFFATSEKEGKKKTSALEHAAAAAAATSGGGGRRSHRSSFDREQRV